MRLNALNVTPTVSPLNGGWSCTVAYTLWAPSWAPWLRVVLFLILVVVLRDRNLI